MRVRTLLTAIALAATTTLGGATSAAAVGDGSSGASALAGDSLSGLIPINLQNLLDPDFVTCIVQGNTPC